MTKVVFVYIFPHSCHRGFAESIGARFWYYHTYFNYRWLPRIIKGVLNGLLLPRGDIYFCEGGSPLAPAAVNKVIFRKVKIVELIADETFMMIRETPETAKGSYPRYVNSIHRIEAMFIDGAVAVSDFAREGAIEFIKGPIRVAFPYIEDGRYESLSTLSPNLESHNIISIGHGRPMKGMDILLEAFRLVKTQVPDSSLYIIGEGYPEQWNKVEGVTLTGYIDNPGPYLEMGSLYVQASWADMFPVAALESLQAGLPTMVTGLTGSKVVISKLGDWLVRRADAQDIAEGILKYFALPLSSRRALSEKARELARPFHRQEMCNQFQKEFSQLLRDIDSQT
jgi:glycosyltransferase involved in cell wall biosynthesis